MFYVVLSETFAWFERADGTPWTDADDVAVGCAVHGVYDDDVVYAFVFTNRDNAERWRNDPARDKRRDDGNGYVFNNVDRCGPVNTCETWDDVDAFLSPCCLGDVYVDPTW